MLNASEAYESTLKFSGVKEDADILWQVVCDNIKTECAKGNFFVQLEIRGWELPNTKYVLQEIESRLATLGYRYTVSVETVNNIRHLNVSWYLR